MNTNDPAIPSSGGNNAAPALLRLGAVLQATVTENLGDNRYRLSMGTQRVQVESPVSLAAGDRLNLQVIRQENGSLGLQLLPDKPAHAPSETAGSTDAIGAASSANCAAATAEVSRQLRVSVDADALRTLLPDPATGKNRTVAGGQQSAGGNDSASSSAGSGNGAHPDRVNTENGRSSGSGSTASGQSATAQGETASAPVILQLIRIPGGGVSLFAPGGGAGTYGALQPTAAGDRAELPAGMAAAFRLQSASLILTLQLPTGSTAQISLPVNGALLQSLPATLAGGELFLQTANGMSATGAVSFTLNGLPLSAASPLDMPAAALKELQQLPDATEMRATISDQAILQGQLRTQIAASAPNAATMDSNDAATRLQAAGLTPGKATLQAAQALLDQGVPVSRGNVQTLLALTAGSEGGERSGLLQAGARLLALDAPVALPLAAGMANLLAENLSLSGRAAGIENTLNTAAQFFSAEAGEALREQARLVGALPVLVGEPQTPQALSSFVSSLGRELLASAQQTVENVTGQLIASSPALQRLDAALEPVLTRLTGLPERGTAVQQPEPADAAPPSVTAASPQSALPAATTAGAPHTAGLTDKTLPQSAAAIPPDATTAPIMPGASTISGTEANRNAMTTPVSGANTPMLSSDAAAIRTAPAPALLPGSSASAAPSTAPSSLTGAATAMLDAAATPEPGLRSELADRLKLAVSLFSAQSVEAALFASATAHPGVQELPEYALPLSAETSSDSLRQAVQSILRAQTPDEAALAAREAMRGLDTPAMRELAAALQQVEREELSTLPGLQHLREASEGLRDLGRTCLAQKAENLAGQEQNPAVWSGQVPLRFGDGREDGNLQMFYRRGKKDQKEWTQRVVLDLNMSGLGSVVGDLQFFKGQLGVALLARDQETVRWLESGSEELAAGLEEAGFPCSPGFRLLQKQPLPEEQPAPQRPGRLDVRA